MKILLINPPFYRFIGLEQDYVPLSLIAVGSQLEKEGHQVIIKNMEIDKNLKYEGYNDRISNFDKYLNALLDNEHYVWNELRDLIRQYNPDKIGITVLNVKYKSSLKIIKISKEFNIPVFVGGPCAITHPNAFTSEVEVITGEFESRFYGGGRIKDLDMLPMPNFDILYDMYSPNGYAHIVSSRGCPFKCKFCASNTIWHRNVTFKSAKRIIDEMTLIKKRFNNNLFTFWDETFTLNKKRLMDFCYLYDIDVKWSCDTRADALNDEVVKAMKNAGCDFMGLGIESGRQHILDYIGKGESLIDFQKTSDILNSNNIKWKAYCIIGFPEETEEDIFETIRFIKSLNPFRIVLSFFTPYEHTELYQECLNKGIIDKNFDSVMFAHQSPYNYFCSKITKERYNEIKKIVSSEVDNYNKEAIKEWK